MAHFRVTCREKMTPQKKQKKTSRKGRRLGKNAWVRAARDALINGGLEAVKIDRLAKSLGATRAAFYWHFEGRAQLLDSLLDFWRAESTKAYEMVLASCSNDAAAELEAMNNMWRDDKDFNPAFDAAMREWARVSDKAARIVRQVDNTRIEALKQMFSRLGYEDREALVRARIAFMNQVGYYTMRIGDSRKVRAELAPIYLKVLKGW